MNHVSKFAHCHAWSFRTLAAAIIAVLGSFVLPGIVTAGSGGGVDGGCAFANTVNGRVVYEACTGANLPMWYPVSSSPVFTQGDLPCGEFGNHKCGVEVGDAMNE